MPRAGFSVLGDAREKRQARALLAQATRCVVDDRRRHLSHGDWTGLAQVAQWIVARLDRQQYDSTMVPATRSSIRNLYSLHGGRRRNDANGGRHLEVQESAEAVLGR